MKVWTIKYRGPYDTTDSLTRIYVCKASSKKQALKLFRQFIQTGEIVSIQAKNE